MKIMVLPRDDKSKGKPVYSLLVGLGQTQVIVMILGPCHHTFYSNLKQYINV